MPPPVFALIGISGLSVGWLAMLASRLVNSAAISTAQSPAELGSPSRLLVPVGTMTNDGKLIGGATMETVD